MVANIIAGAIGICIGIAAVVVGARADRDAERAAEYRAYCDAFREREPVQPADPYIDTITVPRYSRTERDSNTYVGTRPYGNSDSTVTYS